MKHLNILLMIAIVVTIATIFYTYRFIFFHKYEPEYYENWYYHSQWAYPQSARGISDGELYKFVGFRLVEGENPFNINYEAPPLGKYLYGLSEKFLGSAYPVSSFLYLASIFLLFLLLKNLFTDKRLNLAAMLLFVTTPFVATQVKETMLDLPLMFFYLAHVYFFIRFLSDKNLKLLALAGIFLGLATGTKFGAYTPGVLLLDLILLFTKDLKKLFLLFIFYPGTVFTGYVISFIAYFIHHQNPIPWIRLHEKVLSFYLSPETTIDYLNQWRGIFINSYQGWWQPGKTALGDWSPLLPIGVVATFYIFYKSIKNKDKKWIYISGITIVFLITNTFISFWPRYLMPTIPLFVLLVTFIFRKKVVLILLIASFNIPFLINSLATNNPKGDFEASARFMNTRANRELYRSIDPNQRKGLSEEKFINTYENFLDKLDTRKVEVSVGEVSLNSNQASAPVTILHQTKYGNLEHKDNFEFIKINNQWKMKWKWDYIWPGFTPESNLLIEEEPGQNEKWRTVFIMPRVMFDWSKFLGLLSAVTHESTTDLNKRFTEVIPDKYPRFAGFLNKSEGETGIKKAMEIPGVTVRDNENTKAKIFLEENGQKINIL